MSKSKDETTEILREISPHLASLSDKQIAFLEGICEGNPVDELLVELSIKRTELLRWKSNDEDFRIAYGTLRRETLAAGFHEIRIESATSMIVERLIDLTHSDNPRIALDAIAKFLELRDTIHMTHEMKTKIQQLEQMISLAVSGNVLTDAATSAKKNAPAALPIEYTVIPEEKDGS